MSKNSDKDSVNQTSTNLKAEKAVAEPASAKGEAEKVSKELPVNNRDESVPKKKVNPDQKKRTPKLFLILALFALVVALLAGGFAGYEFLILQKQADATALISKTQSSLVTRISNLEQELQGTREALAAEVSARERAQAEHGALNTAMEAVSIKLGRTSNAWRMAEVEYLLTVANHRLILAQDRVTAIAVFEIADQRIKAIGDPALLKVRKTIVEELNALRSVSEPDIAGMALSVGSLANEVERLPLIDTERVEIATGQIKHKAPESWKDIPAAVWEDIKTLVVVRRHQQLTEPLLPPVEAWFLYQNLRLKIEQARLALLRRDTTLFRQNLDEASTWIKTFFDGESTAVGNVMGSITALAKVELQPKIPDVSGSLRELRQFSIEHRTDHVTKQATKDESENGAEQDKNIPEN